METQITFTSRGHTYECTVSPSPHSLSLTISNKQNSKEWAAEFTARYLEKLTRKVGHPQSFEKFLQLLHACLRGTYDNTLTDFLSYNELESICLRRESSAPKLELKRYLILTYIQDSVKAQYPLALTETHSPPSRLQTELELIKSENLRLSQCNQDMQKEFQRVKIELDFIISSLEETNSAKIQQKQEISQLKKQAAEDRQAAQRLCAQLQQANDEILRLQRSANEWGKTEQEPNFTVLPQHSLSPAAKERPSEEAFTPVESMDITEIVSMLPKIKEKCNKLKD